LCSLFFSLPVCSGIGDGNRDWTCDERTSYLKQHCLQFFAAERWLDENMCLNQFIYITVLRDPIKRIESNCRYEKISPENAIEWMTTTTHLPPETRVSVSFSLFFLKQQHIRISEDVNSLQYIHINGAHNIFLNLNTISKKITIPYKSLLSVSVHLSLSLSISLFFFFFFLL
jgi:hypothetical protein